MLCRIGKYFAKNRLLPEFVIMNINIVNIFDNKTINCVKVLVIVAYLWFNDKLR